MQAFSFYLYQLHLVRRRPCLRVGETRRIEGRAVDAGSREDGHINDMPASRNELKDAAARFLDKVVVLPAQKGLAALFKEVNIPEFLETVRCSQNMKAVNTSAGPWRAFGFAKKISQPIEPCIVMLLWFKGLDSPP